MSKKISYAFDMGANSISWAVIEFDDVTKQYRIPAMNSRIFDAGVAGTNEEIAFGKAESRCAFRREKRLLRRQTARRSRRMSEVKHILQRNDMLPSDDRFSENIAALDKKLSNKYISEVKDPLLMPHVFPYLLRKLAVKKLYKPQLVQWLIAG